MNDTAYTHCIQLILVTNDYMIIRQPLNILQQGLLGYVLLGLHYFHVRRVTICSLQGTADFGLGWG